MIPEDLRDLNNTIYIVDRNYRLVDYNRGYERFARGNDGDDILTRWPMGSNILSFLPAVIRGSIQRMYDDVMDKGKIIEDVYDCHSPDVFRRFRMRIFPFLNRFAMHEHCLIATSPLTGGEDLSMEEVQSQYVDDNGIIHQCCHCRRTQSRIDINHWVWVTPLIARHNDFSPNISHTLCPVCLQHYYLEE